MDITFDDLVKYSKIKNVNGSNIKELLKNKELVLKIEELREKDPNLDEVINKLQRCNFTQKEVEDIKRIYDNYFGPDIEKTEEEMISEKYGISIDNIETFRLDNGEEVYKITNADNKDVVLKKSDKEETIEEELENLSDSVGFSSDLDNNAKDAVEYQRLHSYNELKFYTKEELNNKPELLNNLNREQIEEVRTLIKMENVVFINPENGLGLGVNHELILAEYDNEKGTMSITDSTHKNKDTYEEIEDPEIFDDTKKIAKVDEYADLVSTTELPVVKDNNYEKMFEEENEKEEEIGESDKKPFVKKIFNEDTPLSGYVGYALLISIVLMGIIITIIEFVF